MKLENVKITNNEKREVARAIKNGIDEHRDENNLSDEYSIAIMYEKDYNNFYLSDLFSIDKHESEGDVFYKIYSHCTHEKTPTLQEIEKEIFG